MKGDSDRDKKVLCPHCGSKAHDKGKCDCATCGTKITVEEYDREGKVVLKKEKFVAGICKICNGRIWIKNTD